jgi:hypothetical protein
VVLENSPYTRLNRKALKRSLLRRSMMISSTADG